MTISTPPVYIACIRDVPGVVAANNFLAAFNPVGSGKVHVALRGIVSSYSSGTTTVSQSMLNYRITASSGGTLLAANQIAKFRTDWPDASTEIRTGNPTVSILTGNAVLFPYPPVISVGAGESATSIDNPPGASFVMFPGQGILFRTEAGDIDQVWNVTYVWTELDI